IFLLSLSLTFLIAFHPLPFQLTFFFILGSFSIYLFSTAHRIIPRLQLPPFFLLEQPHICVLRHSTFLPGKKNAHTHIKRDQSDISFSSKPTYGPFSLSFC
ncbi:MAG: hypothetical protein J3R72DRAFT_525182, partial [Linnemannia gamsii]